MVIAQTIESASSIETVKKSLHPGPWDNKGYFVLTEYQESARGVIANQLHWLDAQSLKLLIWLHSCYLQQLKGLFSTIR